MTRALCRSAETISLAEGRSYARAVFEVDTGSKPNRIQVLPASSGLIRARDGRTFAISDAKRVIANSTFPMLVDWEHQSESAFGSTRAAGWIQSMSVEGDGVWGQVKWTAQGAADVQGKAFRYLSPVLLLKAADVREVESIISVALTNKPALDLQVLKFSIQRAATAGAAARARCDEKLTQELCSQGYSRDAVEASREELEAKKRALCTLDMAKVRRRLQARGYTNEEIAEAERCKAAQRGR